MLALFMFFAWFALVGGIIWMLWFGPYGRRQTTPTEKREAGE